MSCNANSHVRPQTIFCFQFFNTKAAYFANKLTAEKKEALCGSWTLGLCMSYIIRCVCVSLGSMQLIVRPQLGSSFSATALLLHPFYVF